MSAPSQRAVIHAAGLLVLSSHVAATVLSYVQAPILWAAEDAPRAELMFKSIAGLLQEAAIIGGVWQTLAALVHNPAAALWTNAITLAAATTATVLLYLLISGNAVRTDEKSIKLLLRWALAFAAANLLAYPVFTQDMWLSAAWGRMVLEGANPYHQLFGDPHLSGLPLDHFPMPMTYGPLWAVLSGAVMGLTAGNVLAAGLLFKVTIALFWTATLLLIERATRDRTAIERALGLIMFGWMPLSVGQSVAEGHNDIAMAALAVLWLVLLLRGHAMAPTALAGSLLMKYVTAPLALVDLAHALPRWREIGPRRFILRLIPAIVLTVAAFAMFYRSPAFFDGLRTMTGWEALRPRDAVQGLAAITGLPLWPLEIAVLAAFPAIAAHRLYLVASGAGPRAVCEAAVAVLCTVLFSLVTHPWPWFLVWPLAFAALCPTWWLSRFVMGAALVAPFALAFWWLPSLEDHKTMAALAIYVAAAAWTGISAAPLRSKGR